jgi:hypothetical protein
MPKFWDFPQRLKPRLFYTPYGTAEAVPLQEQKRTENSEKPNA